jgi:DNA replication protein DnaC
MNPAEKPVLSIADQLAKMFDGMSAALDERADRLRPLIAEAPVFGPCPRCRVATTALDREETENESVRFDRLALVYTTCDDCQTEARMRDRLARYGVPCRVQSATLDNYHITQPGQAEAVASVRAWVRDPEAVFLLLLGACGTGKGHLAAGALRLLHSSALWTDHPDLVNGYHGTPMEQRDRYRSRFLRHPVLVIDEMGTKSMTSDTPELFYKILDKRHDRRLKTILIGNIPLRSEAPRPSLLPFLGEDRAVSRLFATATIICPRWKDYRQQ